MDDHIPNGDPMTPIDHDIEEYRLMPSCRDGFDWNNAEWDFMEREYWTEIIQAHPGVIMP